MGMFWQIKIETYSEDNTLLDTCWLDRFRHSQDADTFIREYCKLYPDWDLTDDWDTGVHARKDNKDGTWCYMTAYGQILFDSWMHYVTEDAWIKECPANFSTEGICYDGSYI